MDFAEYNFNPFQFTPGEALLMDAHARHVSFFRGCKKVLDLGAGRGLFLQRFSAVKQCADLQKQFAATLPEKIEDHCMPELL